jgi:hypothetical protein
MAVMTITTARRDPSTVAAKHSTTTDAPAHYVYRLYDAVDRLLLPASSAGQSS